MTEVHLLDVYEEFIEPVDVTTLAKT